MADLNQILERLVQRTEEGKLTWSPTVADDQFRSTVENVRITIRTSDAGHRLEILDEYGQRIDFLDYSSTTAEQDAQLARLFDMARRSALRYDETLEKLAKALEL